MQVLEKHFFDSPLGLVCLAVVDDGYAVKAYLGPVPASFEPDAAAALVVTHGAGCALPMALALCGPRTWARVAVYEPAIAALFAQGQPAPGPGPAGAGVGPPGPAACGCGLDDRHQCYFIGALRRPGCVHQAEYLAMLAKYPPAPATGTGPGQE